jgi:Ca-activated chloride channel family protein
MRADTSAHIVRGLCAALATLVLGLAGCERSPMDAARAEQELARMVGRIGFIEAAPVRAAPDVGASESTVADTLPDIRKYPVTVEPRSGSATVVEIFSSTEKAGSGVDGSLVEIGRAFNERGIRLSDGTAAQVRIRSIPSGTAYEYIAHRRYLPDGFSPSNHLWIRMAQASGMTMTPISDRLLRNPAGIVMKDAVFSNLERKYGTVDVPVVINAVVEGGLAMGYTNPFASSTGLNFLVTVLTTFARGDVSRLLTPEVASAFEAFQRGVPFVSLTTIQMRDSVERGGSLDAFIMEYQTYANTRALRSGYRFLPFGYAHDNPLYAVGAPDGEKIEALKAFAEFVRSPQSLAIASRYGFEEDLAYEPLAPVPDGEILARAQQLWKERKDLGRPVVAVFLSDVSGSMAGERIKALREALVTGSSFIDPGNHIGLVAFSTEVTLLLPVREFDDEQRSRFVAAVRELDTGGNTAMYDGIMVSLELLVSAKRRIPEGKPLLFVLTDGATNRGLELNNVERVIEGLGIPVYTISYGEDVSELGRLSTLNEAASIRADPLDVAYQIGSLLNAEM